MRVIYPDHLRLRLRARRIPERMPERLYGEAKKRYYDHVTFRHIAVMSVVYRRRSKDDDRLRLAAFGLLNPVISAAVMAVSSLSVVGNSVRLCGFRV